jgi:hypothetical protein
MAGPDAQTHTQDNQDNQNNKDSEDNKDTQQHPQQQDVQPIHVDAADFADQDTASYLEDLAALQNTLADLWAADLRSQAQYERDRVDYLARITGAFELALCCGNINVARNQTEFQWARISILVANRNFERSKYDADHTLLINEIRALYELLNPGHRTVLCDDAGPAQTAPNTIYINTAGRAVYYTQGYVQPPVDKPAATPSHADRRYAKPTRTIHVPRAVRATRARLPPRRLDY